MTGLLLSRRHRALGRVTCAICDRWSEIPTAPFVFTIIVGDIKTLSGRVYICVGCLREGVKVATEGREVRRK